MGHNLILLHKIFLSELTVKSSYLSFQSFSFDTQIKQPFLAILSNIVYLSDILLIKYIHAFQVQSLYSRENRQIGLEGEIARPKKR